MASRTNIGATQAFLAISRTLVARRRRRLFRRLACSALALAALAGSASAAPQGPEVVSGNVSINQNGSTTTITAGHNSIINYQSFNINPGETVQFVQPSATSRVLNRILSDAPTYINGNLYANGQVFFVNRAGVFFGPNAVIDVGQIYAAAGNMSNRDFLAGNLNFTELSGRVENMGTINAQTVALIGRSVANRGTISGIESTVILAAGDAVYIRESSRGGMMVQIADSRAGEISGTDKGYGVENSGTINTNGGRATMMAGDIYSLAIRNTGRVNARDIHIQGGQHGQVRINGTLDATSTVAGQRGGTVNVTGGTVIVDNATIDASGHSGGGNINIGGQFQGGGDLAHATNTIVSRNSTLRADALTTGSGGLIVVWSDVWTWFAGAISAQGITGAGGAEVSSEGKLDFSSMNINLLSANGARGVLLLDPGTLNVTVAAGTIEGNLPNILAGAGGAVESVSYTAINAALAAADVLLQATNIINLQTIGGNFTFTNLVAGRTLTFQTTTVGGGNGIFFQTVTDTLTGAGGNFVFSSPGDITLGNITSVAGNISIFGTSSLNPAGAVAVRTITTAGGNFSSRGTSFTGNGAINTGGGGNAGSISILHSGTVSTFGLQTTGGNITVSGTNYTQAGGTFLQTGAVLGTVTPGSAIVMNMTGTVTIPIQINASVLAISAVGGITLSGGGFATSAAMINSGSGNIQFSSTWDITNFAALNQFATGNIALNVNPVAISGAHALNVTGITQTGFNSGNALNGVVATNGQIALQNQSGAVNITQALNAGTSDLRILSTAGVTQSGAGTITANTLGVRNTTAGNIDLSLTTNAVNTVAFSNTFAGGSIAYTGTAGVVLGTVLDVIIPGIFNFGGDLSGATSSNGNIALVSGIGVGNGGALAINQAINAGTGTVRLGSVRSITQNTTTGLITAQTLAAITTGLVAGNGIFLSGLNVVDNFSANVTSGNREIQFRSANAVTVGTVAGVAGFNGGNPVTGIAMGASGQLLLVSAGAGGPLTINEPISVPGGTVRLVSGQGVAQGVDGGIVANFLGVVANGLIALDGATNTVNGLTNVAIINNANGAAIRLSNPGGQTVIGTVTAPTTNAALFNGGVALSGITTTGNGAALIISGNLLTINQAINVGTGTLRLQSGGGIEQSTLGGTTPTITAGTLAAVNTGAGNILLDVLVNAIGTFAASNAVNNGTIALRSSNVLTVGTVAGSPANFNGGADVVGVTGNTGQTITLISGGAGLFNINQPISAPAGTVRLSSQGGVAQAVAGVITAANLGVLNAVAGSIALDTAANVVSGFAASNTLNGGGIALRSTAALTIGTVAAGPAYFNLGAALAGLATVDGNITLIQENNGAAMTLARTVNAGTGILRLASQGGITQTTDGGGSGLITAAVVGAVNTTAGSITLTLNNLVGTFAASNTFAGGSVEFVSAQNLGIGTVAGNPANFNGGVNLDGVTANDGTILLRSGAGGPLNIATAVNAGAAGNVFLESVGGITQTGAGLITGNGLFFRNTTAGNVTLTEANVVGNIAGANTFATGTVAINSTLGLTVGTSVANATFNAGNAINGLAAAGDITLTSGGAIAINQAITATDSIIRLASTGSITQAAAGILTGTGLGVINRDVANGAIVLDQLNLIAGLAGAPGTFAALNLNATAGAGSILFLNSGSFNVGTITAIANVWGTGAAPFADLSGVNSAAGNSNTTLISQNGGMSLNQAVNAGTGELRLQVGGLKTATEAITQAAAGTITAGALAVSNSSTGHVVLTQTGNVLSTIAVASTGAGAQFSLLTTTPALLTIGQVAAQAGFNGGNAVTGITTSNGSVIVQTQAGAAGPITVANAINTGTGDLTLETLDTNNASAININAAINSTGAVLIRTNADGSTITTTADITGGTGNVIIRTLANNSGITLNNAVTATTGTITVQALGTTSPVIVGVLTTTDGNIIVSGSSLVTNGVISTNLGAVSLTTTEAAGTIAINANVTVTSGLMAISTAGINAGITIAAAATLSSTTGNIQVATTGNTSSIRVDGIVTTTTGAPQFTTTGTASLIEVFGTAAATNGSDARIRSTSGNALFTTTNSNIIFRNTGAGADEGFVVHTGGTITVNAGTGTVGIEGNLHGNNGVDITGATINVSGVAGALRIIEAGNQAGLLAMRGAVVIDKNARIDGGAGRVLVTGAITGTAAGFNLGVFSTFISTFNNNPALILPAIVFGGNIGDGVNPFGTITLGGSSLGPRSTAQINPYSTIVFANGAQLGAQGTIPSTITPTAFSVFATNFTMQQREKLLSLGNFTLNVTGASTLGDVSVLGAFNIPTGTINFLDRPGEPLFNNVGLRGNDSGVDVVASTINWANGFTVNGAPNPTFLLQRISTDSGNANINGNAATLVGRNPGTGLTLGGTFVNGAFTIPVDLVATGGNFGDPSGQLPAVFETVQRVDPPAAISAGAKDFLKALKINVRDVGPDELADFLSGTAYYDDTASTRGGDTGMMSTSVGVSVRRISPAAAEELREAWNKLAIDQIAATDENGKPIVDSSGNPVMQPRAEYIRGVFDSAYRDFVEQAGTADTSPPVFESFILTTPKHAKAKAALDEVRAFIAKLDNIGLTRQELVRPREELLRVLKPESIPDFRYFRELVIRPASISAMK